MNSYLASQQESVAVTNCVKYVGIRTSSGCTVLVKRGDRSKRLSPRFDLREHSPTGFEWGYGGSGPAQLALALLADWSGSEQLALEHYQEFKRRVVSCLAHDRWELNGDDIRQVLNETIGHVNDSTP